ncbi:hypothetical protein LGZ99_23840 [Photorhabdus temperata]|uniref:Uncharacterized protein n=1 Tax=Photorhabdus temperata subsp. temperata Meg1 TaxID=1393735 RepID=A0A081RQX1_PHOTE|nr:hypothetical protein [Photorhabdus temperata]KER01074.1 hypothetical protein MEG1DRAFT_04345 [Photorhabdus temperata subsp. temperata Meg1]MCT8350142.1 hypothetical protein [Photorhabdus temperata]
MNKYEYIISGDKYPNDAYEFESWWHEYYKSYIAEDAAEHYFDYYGGWELNWPIDFEIYINGKILGIFTVSLEMEPSFSTTKKEGNE